MNSILSIAASGLAAAVQRLQVSANNVANANSDGPTASASAKTKAQYQPAYNAEQVNQTATAGGGTATTVTNVQPGTVTTYNPTAPYADQNGNVSAPNVDLSNQAVQQAIASYQFTANSDVMSVYQKMMKTLLNIQT
jgi:flagellar basal-body rod protein FlgC